jgi:hypothetical protein
MAFPITFTVLARLNLEGILRQQRTSDDELLMLNHSLWKTIPLPKEEKKAYVRKIETVQGPVEDWIMDSIEAAPPQTIELEMAEIRRLDAVLKEWKGWRPEDVDWMHPVRDQLRQAQNGNVPPAKRMKSEK